MSDKKFKDNLSIGDLSGKRLQTTEENISEMEHILSLMDEIDRLKGNSAVDKGEIDRLQSSVGGYSRVEIVDLLSDLKAKRQGSMTDIERQKQKLLEENRGLKSDLEKMKGDIDNLTKLFAKQVELNRIDSQAEYMDAQSDNLRFSELQGQIERLKKEIGGKDAEISEEAKMLKAGDNTLIFESIYNGLSIEIENFKKEIADELKFSYTQQQAIYEDLSEQLAIVGALDIRTFEEKLTEISQLKATDIKVLEEKIEKISGFDLESFAKSVSDKVLSQIKLLPAKADGESETVAKLSEEIREIKAGLSQLLSVKGERDTSEFALLDYEISEYLKESSPIALADLLVDARNIKNKALKHMENGNAKMCSELIDGLKARLRKTSVYGSRAIGDIVRISEQYHIPLRVSKQKLNTIKSAVARYEQGSIMPDFDLINDLIRLKKDAFKDAALTVIDKQTFDMISAESKGLDLSGSIKGDKAERLRELKKELTAFDLSCVFDFDIARPGSEITDTDLLLAEIKALKDELKSDGAHKPAEAELTGNADLSLELTKLMAKPEKIAETETPKKRKKAAKVLRPSLPVSPGISGGAKLNTVKKPKANLQTTENPDSLTSELVKKLAENMASRRVKN